MNTIAKRAIAALMLLCWPASAWTHPHVFIDTGLDLMFGDHGHLEAVQVVRVYDEFNSLLIVAERGWDPNATLGPEQRRELAALDSGWSADLNGDLRVYFGEERLRLGGPERAMADYRQGHVILVHLRRLAEPVDPARAPVLLQVYDASFYTLYRIAVQPQVHGRADCSVTVEEPDRGAADARLSEALAGLRASGADIETNFPSVGAAYAESVLLNCGSGS
jgi:ABC-type uncharacterized transport system substrate-binding protein